MARFADWQGAEPKRRRGCSSERKTTTVLDDARGGEMHASMLNRVRPQSGGFIIVAVLWILGALATLAVIYSLYVRQTALEFVTHDERLQAQALAMSGVELAAYQLTADPRTPPLQGQFAFEEGTADVAVSFSTENARIDLNYAPKELLAGLLASVGVNSDAALTYADRIIGWRTPLKSGQNDTEAGLYQAAGKSYGPRHAPFQHPDELALVADIPSAAVDRILPYVTVYSGGPQVNVLAAPPQVLAAFPGMTPESLQLLLTLRQGSPQELAAQLGALPPDMTVQGSKANRVSVDIRFRSGRRMQAEAVILLAGTDTEPYRVLSWSNNVPPAGQGF
jgi:general secretion pathway protein K